MWQRQGEFKLRIIVSLLLVFLSGLSWSASFNCAKASTPVEKIICGDESLSTLDSVLANYYQQAVAIDGGVRQSQKEWLTERDRCTDSGCLSAAYVARIDDLERFLRNAQAAPEAMATESTDAAVAVAQEGFAEAGPMPVAEVTSDASASDGAVEASVSTPAPSETGPFTFIRNNWFMILLIAGGVAGAIVWNGIESACPKCGKWFSKKKVGAEILHEAGGYKTIDRQDHHKDRSGKIIKTVHRKEQIHVINREWRVYCRCTHCLHEWNYTETTQSES